MVCVAKQALLTLCLGMLLLGCQVSINKQTGSDPCDPNPCLKTGACAQWTGTCSNVGGKAVCDYTAASATAPKGANGKPLGFEVSETTCDGIDNDCDGLTDEGVIPPKTVCAATGVCAGQSLSHATCDAGTWICDWKGVSGYESPEISCDGTDNDCNGKTDDNVQPGPSTCKRSGVCASLPAPVCASGAWDCHYSGADYESSETKCDGKDNDCDGIVDANLTVSGLTCKSSGVCANGVRQVCVGGSAACDYSQVTGFETNEQSCDGQDNDCDGVTDNLAGSTVPIQSSDSSGCLSTGVCASGGAAITRSCAGGKFVCNYSAVPKYEAQEQSCDGKDNDCDGTTDANLLQPGVSPCPSAGVCGQASAICTGGLWTCNWASIATKGYEPFEQSCDGIDNDCDGQTDETVSPKNAKCKSQGVCAFGVSVTCSAGKATCDYTHVGGFENSEKTCDGMDNDCDGQTDEPDALDLSKSGCSLGVCAAALPKCVTGTWSCDTTGISADYQSVENKCDGKDNDCDGFTDEGQVTLSDAQCKTSGVCATGVLAGCVGGVAICSYQNVKSFETTESLCDGADNDCDGKTDQKVCAPSAPCQGDTNCTTGTCVSVLGGSGKACTVKPNQCAAIGDGGQMVFADSGATRCLTGKSTASCTSGKWGTPTVCGTSVPVCIDGACVLCAPNALRCDPGDNTKIQQCAADGKSVSPKGSCASGTHCSGDGACVPDASVQVNDTASGYAGVVTVLTDGTVVTAWLTDSGAVATVNMRLYSATGTALGASTPIHGSTPAIKNSRLAITPVGSGFAIAWVTSFGGDLDIEMRLFDGTGSAKGAAFVANTNDKAGDQSDPALASTESGTAFVLTWTSDKIDGAGLGIAAQLYDNSGIGGTVITANAGAANDDPTDGDESQSAVTMRADGGFLVTWSQFESFNTQRIRGHLFNASGTSIGNIAQYSQGNGSAIRPVVTHYAKGFLVAWSGSSIDGGGTGIALRQVDAQNNPTGSVVAVNTFTSGDQSEVAISPLASGGAIVGWTSPLVVNASSGSDIASRTVGADGAFVGSESVLTSAESAGDQSAPAVAVFADGRFAWVFKSRANSADPFQVRLLLP